MLLMIDNYDSFTYNLVQYFAELGQEVKVVRNDEIKINDITILNPEFIVLDCPPMMDEKLEPDKIVLFSPPTIDELLLLITL